MKTTLHAFQSAATRLVESFSIAAVMTAGAIILASNGAAQTTTAPPALLPLPPASVSTIPSNGDVNPYGVAFVPKNFRSDGMLQPGDVLVSNFNNSLNLQGTGSTIVRITPRGQQSLFFQGQGGLGLTAALAVLPAGYVFVGSLPTTDGTSATVKAGSILILSRDGKQLGSIANQKFVNGPWGMALYDYGNGRAQLFTSNVLDGTIDRFDMRYGGGELEISDAVQIGSGYNHRVDPAALVLGPSGLYFDVLNNTLFVASSADNAVYALPGAATATSSLGSGKVIYSDNVHLHGPIDLVMAPNGNFIVANSDGSNADPNQPSELVEFTVDGTFVAQFSVDPNNGGAFGIGLNPIGSGLVRVAAVDDNANSLTIWTTSSN